MTNIEAIMYTLGQIARAVYPKGDIPPATLDQLLVHPLKGIALLAKRIPKDDEGIAELVNKLPGADMPTGPVKIEDQGPFWTGWYHYMTALDRAGKWGPAQLARAGTLLYGDRWQSDLARAIGVSDRSVRGWVAGERSPPAGVWADIAGLLRQRQSEGVALLRELDGGAA